MIKYILILELGHLEGELGFNLINSANYTNESAYKCRKYLSELIKLRMLNRRGNRFYITSRGDDVYTAALGGQVSIFTVTDYPKQDSQFADYPF